VDYEIRGKTVIVTGGARGLGKSMVRTFAEEGCNVVVCDLDEKNMAITVEEVKKMGVKCISYKLDVTKLDMAYSMAEAVMKEFGTIDILVNNAGTTHPKNFWETDRADWEADIETSLYGTLCCSRAVVPYMIKQNSGRIINISSNAGRVGFRKEIGYCAAKAGILGVTKALAQELASYDIAVNAIAPGFILTEMVKPLIEEEEKRFEKMNPDVRKERERLLSKINPLGRYGYPEDIAYMALFLSSAKAARYITGQTYSVDGGGTML